MKLLRWLIWIATGVFWCICVWLTHTGDVPPLPGPQGDKARHYLGYGALAGAWFLSYWAWKRSTKRAWLVVIGLGAVYAALDEITQPMFGRDCEFWDWMADMGGTLTAAASMTLSAWLISRALQKKAAAL